MGSVVVDQIGRDGELLHDVDTRLSNRRKDELLLAALPGAVVETLAGERVVRYRDQAILKKQITHLGNPWPAFKKRIQIPIKWLDIESEARAAGLVTRFIGIYSYRDVTIFVDFDPATYVRRKANNSAAHVATNDLHQAQVVGQFSRVDRNGNHLTSVRADELSRYLSGGVAPEDPRIEVFRRFNAELLDGREIPALEAVQEMHAAAWPDRFQAEWPGFYLEYRFDAFVRRSSLLDLVEFQKDKRRHRYDFDLAFRSRLSVDYYGDLKASDIVKHESPGNDAEDVRRCVQEYGRFWYVIYEHTTKHARDNGDVATIAWNEWRRSVGHKGRKEFDPLSYARKFKESVTFRRMMILEVNEANFEIVLGSFRQGQQPDGAERALKVMINKKYIDNFLIYTDPRPSLLL